MEGRGQAGKMAATEGRVGAASGSTRRIPLSTERGVSFPTSWGIGYLLAHAGTSGSS